MSFLFVSPCVPDEWERVDWNIGEMMNLVHCISIVPVEHKPPNKSKYYSIKFVMVNKEYFWQYKTRKRVRDQDLKRLNEIVRQYNSGRDARGERRINL